MPYDKVSTLVSSTELKFEHQKEIQSLQAMFRRHVCGASFPPAIVMSQLSATEEHGYNRSQR